MTQRKRTKGGIALGLYALIFAGVFIKRNFTRKVIKPKGSTPHFV